MFNLADYLIERFGLTPRESELTVYMMENPESRNRELADAHGVTIDTIKTHLQSIYKKVEVKTRAHLVMVVGTINSLKSESSLHETPEKV